MFKYQGFEYTLDEVTQAASNEQLSVDEYVNKHGLETVEVTDEIQTTPTEGKTNGAVAKGATATPETGEAPESTESDSANTLLELQKDVAEYGELDTSRDAILARRRLSRFEDKLISSQTIDLEEVVVTGFGDNTPITREEWSKLDNRLKNQNKYKDAFAKGELTKADVQRAQYEGYVGEESGARSLIDNIANANANIPEQEITNKTYEVYFEKTPGGGTGWIDAPVDLGTTTVTPGGTVQINRRAATKEEKEQRIYDAAIAANLNDQGAKDYVALYNQYQDKGTLNPLNDYQKESIPTANQQALYTIENRNKELVANNYNEDVQDFTSVLLKETPEGQDLDKVKNDLKVGGSTLVARQEQYNNDFNVLAPKIEKINDAIQVLDKDIETYKKRLQDFAYPVTSTGQETGNNIYNKLQQKVNERNAIATGPEAQALQEENLKLADQGVQILKMQQQYNVNLQKYDDLKDLDQTFVALNKDYRFSTRTALNIEQSFGGSAAIAGAYTARAAAFLTSGLAELTQSGASGFDFQNVLDSKLVRGADALIGTAVNYNQAIEEKIQALPAPITVDEVRKGKASGWAFISDSTASAAPTLLTIAGPQLVTGLVAKGFTSGMSAAQRVATASFNKGLSKGMAKVSGNLFGLQTGSQTIQSVEIAKKFNPKKIEGLKAEIEKTKDPIVKRQLENQIVSLENSLNKSTFQTGVSGLVTGFITKYSEQAVTLKLFDDFNRVAKNIGKNKFIKELKSGRLLLDKDAVSKAWIPQTLELGGVVGGGLIKENAQESLESILDQGIVRNIILGENVNVFEEINEDLFANTSFATLLMLSGKTINNANTIIKEHVTSNSELSKYQSLTRQLIEAQDLPTPDRIKKSKEILLDLGLQDIVNISKLNTLTTAQIKEIGEIEVAIKKITRDATTLANSTTGLPTESEIKSLQNLQEQSVILKNRKNDILSVRSKRNQEFIDKQNLDIKTNPETIFHLNLFESSNIMADAMVGKGNEIYFLEEDTADLEKFKGRTLKYKDENGVNKEVDAFDMVTSGSQNAYAFDNVVVVDVNESKKSILQSITNSNGKFAAVTALHEVSHLRNKNKKIKFTGDSAEALTNKKAVTEAINMLDDKLEQESITQNDYDAIKKRLAQYENDGDYEEFMQVLSDAVNLGILNKSDFNPNNVLNSFKGLFNNITNKIFGDQSEVFVQFNTGSDVYNYIDSFRKQAISGVAIADVDEEDETTIKASKAVNDLASQYKNNKESMSEQDISNLQDQYQRLGIDALQRWAKQRGVPLQVDENVISDINNQFESVMKNYTPTNRVTGKPMQLSTYVGNILGRRVGPKIVEDYTRRTGQSTITQAVEQTQFADETAEQAFEIEERAQAEESGRSKLIDVRKSPRVKKVLPTLEKEIKINEGDSSVEILNNNRSKFASEIYNVPEDKIEKVDNLTYSKNKPETSELGRIQQDFSNAQETERSIKTMPEFNVTTMESTITEQGERVPVSPEVRGRSMKIGQTVLDFFYEPYTDPASESTDRAVRAMAITNKSGRSKGKTTQTKVYRLKPEFRPNRQGKISPQAVSKAREWAGVDVDLNELSKNERRNYATKLAAWARMRGGQVALSVADKSLPESAPKQQRADTRAGRSRLMFSKKALIDVTQARDINKVLKTLGMDSASVPDNKRAEIQESFLDSIKKHKLTTNVFLAGAFAFSGAKYKRKADGNVYYELTNGEEIIGVARRDSEGNIRRNKNGKKLFDQPTAEQVVEQFGEGVKLLPGKGRLYYGINDPAYQTALAEANKNSEGKNEGKARRVNINAVNTDKGKAQAKINMQVLDDVVSQLDQAIKNGMPKELAAMVIAQGYQATTGLIKIAAPFRYFSKNPQYGTSLKQKTGDKFREEHNPPASVVGASIIYGFATNSTSQIMTDIKNNYYQTKLSKADDQKLDDAKLDATLPVGTTIADNPAIRFIDAGIDLNSIVNYETGQTMAEELGVALKPSDVNVDTVFDQNQILKTVLDGTITAKEGQNLLNEIAKLKSIPKAGVGNNNENNTIKFSKQVPNQEILDNLGNADKAMSNARNPEAPVKKIRVFDFDDTLARSNSNVLYEMPDGTTGKLNATQFAARAGELEAQGAEFDFSEFSKVVDGKRGPVFKAIENIVKARGAEDVFILTARPANAAGPIKEFMDALGVNLPIENIVGLGDGKAEAKARWMTGKAAEGYNDFFFVDDAYKNVKAVQDALNVFDVKSKVQQAKIKFSKKADLDRGFNDILENKTGIASEKEYGRVKAEVAGAGKGKLNFFIPPSAEDFVGLLYATLGKGKLGDQQMAWYKTHLLNPYARAMNELSSARISMMNDYKLLKKQLEIVPKNLRKKVPGEPFTREQAVRVYIWDKQGMSIPGISKKDQADLSKYVSDNAELQIFADQLVAIQKGDQYAAPKEGWPAGTITNDMLEGLNTTKRAKYLEQWQTNADVIFSEKNLNKLEAAYGKPYRLAMENMLQRMKSGRNRNFQGDTLTGRFTDWVTGSIGTIMFFNTRSAILQTISSINFVNFTDNNILAAGKAFANQKQYWSDFMTLMNSDFLKERRGGLRINVSEADIADMAKKGGAKGVINKLLEFGFTPTQIADSFAIASGGSAFYRNRIKSLKKQGMTDAEAEAQAFVDFRETAEESQQSSRPDRISMQQAGPLGRLVLAFANTPAQYARLIKKAASDLKNGRGDAKTNISKIIYYGVAQNLLFNALQQALFAFAFDDDEEDTDEQKKKYVSIANGMMDSLLRGMGLGGAIVSVGKNAIIRIINEMEKKNPKLEKVGYEITKLSPPISAKLSRINQAARSYQWDKDEMKEKGWSLDNPAYLASANVIAALTNVTLDRAIKKTNNVVTATSQDLETWERLTLLGGWQDWEIGIDEEKPSNKPQPRKSKYKKSKIK